jgi:peptidoglycan hydrolase CwlO-like protein
MLHYIKKFGALAFASVIILSSCAEATTNAEETTEINTMDSTSKAVKENTDKLEEQTKKVEASIEKVDSELKPNN